ncbi:MAG: cytochrome c biogenesis protein ResB [Planctomycetes bacterium]|nr:cytochrome c biogenesis protein ResB [Planctomycetota bacterium]
MNAPGRAEGGIASPASTEPGTAAGPTSAPAPAPSAPSPQACAAAQGCTAVQGCSATQACAAAATSVAGSPTSLGGRLLHKGFDLLASYGFAVVLLSFLLLLTFLGTLEQGRRSLFEVQTRYFESLLVLHDFLGVTVPLPGVYLLLFLLGINLLAGGFIRIRKSRATVGVLIVHLGILVMLVSGLIEYYFSTKGHLTLYEGQMSDEYQSYFEWELSIGEVGGVKEWVIPGERFMNLAPHAAATFENAALPVTVSVRSVTANADVVPVARRGSGDGPAVGGYVVRPLPPRKVAESNMAALYATIAEKSSVAGAGGATPATREGILWGAEEYPLVVEAAGRRWYVQLARRRWRVPFVIRLDAFRHELHPRTGIASSFESDVTKRQRGVDQRVNISMNKPLRDEGYTFFQASWGPEDAKPGEPLFSTFAVVRNPADRLPLYACIIIAAGLLVHFLPKLVKHVRSEAGRRA